MRIVIWKSDTQFETVDASHLVVNDRVYMTDIIQMCKDVYSDVNDLYKGFWWRKMHLASYGHADYIVHQLIDFAFQDNASIAFTDFQEFWKIHTTETLHDTVHKEIIHSYDAHKLVLTHYQQNYPGQSLQSSLSYSTPLLFTYHSRARPSSMCFLPCDLSNLKPSYFSWLEPLTSSTTAHSLFLMSEPLDITHRENINIIPESVVTTVLNQKLLDRSWDVRQIDELVKVFAPLSGSSARYSPEPTELLRNTTQRIDAIETVEAVQTMNLLVKPCVFSSFPSVSFQNNNVFGMFTTSAAVFAIKWNHQYKVHTNIMLDDKKMVVLHKTLPAMNTASLENVCIFAFECEIGIGYMFLYPNGVYRIAMLPSMTLRLTLHDVVHSLKSPIQFITDQLNEQIVVGGFLPIFDTYLFYTKQISILKYSLRVNLSAVSSDRLPIIKKHLKVFQGYILAKSTVGRDLFIYNPFIGREGGINTKESIITLVQTMLDDKNLTMIEVQGIVADQFNLTVANAKAIVEEAQHQIRDNEPLMNLKMKRKDIAMFWLEETGSKSKHVSIYVTSCPSQHIKNTIMRNIKSCTIFDERAIKNYQTKNKPPPVIQRSLSKDKDTNSNGSEEIDSDDFDDVMNMYEGEGGEGMLNGPTGAKEIRALDELRDNKTLDVMEMLKKADRNLFYAEKKNGTYSRQCQFSDKRQPIPITKKEKEYIDANYPNAYTFAYQTGPSYPKCQENYYICPSWWCEGNKVALSNEDLLKLKDKGYKCPKGPYGKHVDEHPYYLHGDVNEGRIKFPAPLRNRNVNNNLMPCCFKKTINMDPKNIKKQLVAIQQKLNETDCVDPSKVKEDPVITKQKTKPKIAKKKGADEDGDGDGDGDDDQLANEEEEEMVDAVVSPQPQPGRKQTKKDYIKASAFSAPNIEYEMASLPILLAKYFDSHKCNGNTKLSTRCFVRSGVTSVQYIHNSFLSCIAYVLYKKTGPIPSLSRFVEHIIDNIPIKNFIYLNNGNTVKKYYDETKSPFLDVHFQSFKKWKDTRLESYIKKFKLKDVYDIIRNPRIRRVDDIAEEAMKLKVLREYYVYNSFRSFCNFLKDPHIPKTHVDIISMFSPTNDWINLDGIRFIVLSATSEYDIHIACDPYSIPDNDMSRPIALIYHTGDNIYEVISYLYYDPNFNHNKYNILYNTYVDDARYVSIFSQQRSYGTPGVQKIIELLAHIELEDDIIALTVDYSFCITGVVTKSRVFIPLIQSDDSGSYTESDVRRMGMSLANLYADDVYIVYITSVQHLRPSSIAKEKMLKHVRNVGYRGDFEYHFENDLVHEKIFIGYKHPIPYTDRDATPSEIVHAFIEHVRRQPDITRKISLLMSHINPMSSQEVHAEIKKLVYHVLGEKRMNTVHVDDLSVAVQRIAGTDIDYHIGNLYKNIVVHENETYYTEEDIQHGAIKNMLQHIKNPYKHVMYTIQDTIVHRNVSKHLAHEIMIRPFQENQCDFSPIQPATRAKDLNLDSKFETATCKGFPTDLYGIFAYVAKIAGNRTFTKELMHNRINRHLEQASQSTPEQWSLVVQRLRRFGSFASSKRLGKKDVSVQDIMDVIRDKSYEPSLFDIREISKHLGINIVIIGEANCYGILNEQGILPGLNSRNRTIMLQLSLDHAKRPVYHPIMYGRKKLILSNDDIRIETIKSMVKKYNPATFQSMNTNSLSLNKLNISQKKG
jgi:hypothetical protein